MDTKEDEDLRALLALRERLFDSPLDTSGTSRLSTRDSAGSSPNPTS
ncbi:MAG: hypothetical protein ABC606_00690 [Candidatus Methanosuratincola petrocarbonis]